MLMTKMGDMIQDYYSTIHIQAPALQSACSCKFMAKSSLSYLCTKNVMVAFSCFCEYSNSIRVCSPTTTVALP